MGRVYFPTNNDIGKRTLSGVTLGSDYVGFRAPAEPAPRAASTLVTLGMIATPGGLMVPEYGDPGGPGYGAVITAAAPSPAPVSTLMPVKVDQPASPSTYWGGNPIIARPVVSNPPASPTATPIYSIGSPVAAPQPVGPVYGPVLSVPTPTPTPAAPPVSQQNTPTPIVTVPPAASTGAVLVTSGGGTASPNVAPAAATPTPITYTTDASGNIINAQTGAIVVPAAQAASTGTSAASMNAAAAAPAASSSVTDQIAAWLGGSTSIGSYAVPNALLAAAVVLGFAWLEGGGSTGKKR